MENNSDTNNTFQMYHGGKRWSRIPSEILGSSQGRYEGGVGIYFTNSYDTARKYAKGSKVVHLVDIDKNFKDIKDVELPLSEVLSFIKNLSGMRHRTEIAQDLQSNASRKNQGYVSANVLNNLIVNHEAGAGKVGVALTNFLVSKGVDASLEYHSGDEFWLVVFNPNIIKKVTVVNPRTINSNSAFMLPIPFKPRYL